MNAIQALISTYSGASASTARQQSQFATFTFIITSEIEAFVPVIITNPNTGSLSAGPEVTVYRSTDLGLTWETDGTLAAVGRGKTAALVQRKDVQLSTGWYLISVMVGGGQTSTFTAQLGTAWAITAYA